MNPYEGMERNEDLENQAINQQNELLNDEIRKNIEEAQTPSQESITREALENLKELQDDGKGVVRELIDKVRDGLEDAWDTVKDFLGIDDDEEKANDFDKEAFQENIEEGTAQWHEQLEPYSCAIASQHFIISEYTDAPVTEQDLIELASEMGWYEELGTPMADVGNLLMSYGIDVTTKTAGDFNDLLEATANGDRVLVSVQNMAMTTEWADGYPAYSANHMVEVLGIDNSDPENPRVIVNDPGIPNGQGLSMTRENFEDAWMTGGGYMCVAHRPDGQ